MIDFCSRKKLPNFLKKIKRTKTSTKIMILLPVISMLISTTAPFIPGLLENRIAFDAVSLFALSLIVLFMILLSIKVKKQPWHGILCFFTICIGVLFYIIFIGYTALWDYLL